ncbi:MAG: CHC2 zinc finger domain-containing protein, partial [Acinetobacter sp.]|nr:CHC2 zinc finger domain-containing protein [Acinetobacter sp.]
MAIPQHTIDQILDRTDIVDLIGQRVKLKKTGRTYSGCCPFHQEKSPSFHVYRDKQYYHCFGCQANGNAIRFLMDIDNRNFVDVMKELSSHAGVELPKDNHDNKKLSYKREVSKPKPAVKAVDDKVVDSKPAEQKTDSVQPLEIDPFEAFSQYPDPEHFDPTQFDSVGFDQIPQDGNLYDLLENIAQFYERQLPNSKVAQNYFKHRGLSAETIQYWRLGYAPEDWQHL